MMKENESLKELLTKANQTINSLRVENKILLDELYSIRLANKSEFLFRDATEPITTGSNGHQSTVQKGAREGVGQNTKSTDHSTGNNEQSSAGLISISSEEMQQIQNRILKRMLYQSSLPNTEVKTTGKKRRNPSADASLSFKKNVKVSYDDDGNPIMPLTFGVVTILSLGSVVTDRPAFHSKRYIWPVGFKSTRSYASITNPNGQGVYYSQIVDGGDAPKFEVWSEDLPDRIFVGATPTGAWGFVVKLANELRGKKDASNSASGPDYFGLSNQIVAKLIEELPGANLCTNYEGSHSKETTKFLDEE